jgi:fructokinase
VIGLGSFGPLDVNPESPTYGFITSTPKPNWQNTDIAGTLHRELGKRVAFDTDVNAAALGEFTWGASRGVDPSLYLTIGTGIGGGFIRDGKPLKGLLTPEMGHIRIPHDRELDPFPGACPFHGDCFEGLASGEAIRARKGQQAEALEDGDPFWELEAEYIASALVNYICVISPRKIILGGGIMQRSFLFGGIRRRTSEMLNEYLQSEMLLKHIEQYIVPPRLGNRAGVLGAIALAICSDRLEGN